jgi:adenine phosphoribosyltransferase
MSIDETNAGIEKLKAAIRDVPDFPKKGIVFKDITTLLRDPSLLRLTGDLLSELVRGQRIDKVVAIESRGFILGGLLADRLGAGFVPVRKPGKLPSKSLRASYDLEYGSDSLEIHEDALGKGERVIIVDDVIATGGTAKATAELVAQLGGNLCAFVFLVELGFLKGRERLTPASVLSLIQF